MVPNSFVNGRFVVEGSFGGATSVTYLTFPSSAITLSFKLIDGFSAGASSPAVPVNAGSIDWLGHGQGSKAGSLSRVGSQNLRTSLSTSAGGSALGSSQPSCRPWERGDVLRRLSTFKPANWFGKPKAASSLNCARRGWVNFAVDN
ncbi:hypothetical protein RHGRI_009756 [Rhododendron griersonianum]|uniref:C3HC-type domain-containing protein n=1 Tax=Rhododendron griersonianum TaxID=479676 RepID=A0AAV6KFX9_9ERIC|nr:hypothetical protein RHGRI_009756 [Rhododendron griersonianum]